MITASAIEIAAPPALVWEVFADVERWPEWTASVTTLRALDGPGLAVGKRFEIKQPRLPRLVWEVTELVEGASWTWEQRSPGGRTIASHEVTARLMRSTTKRYLELEAQGLKARSEQLRGSTP